MNSDSGLHAQRGEARVKPRGQTAVGFLVLMGFVLVLVTMTINLGQMAQVRTETSNAADAGALAGASWVASGQNEAAMVAQKMNEGLPLAIALYQNAPFCPGPTHRAYADQLWISLVQDPSGSGDDGPYRFLSRVADGAMWAAWHIGYREMLTASANNMMMRFVSGVGPDGNYADMAKRLTYAQQQEDLKPNPGVGGVIENDLNWTNGLDESDPAFLRHNVKYELAGYPYPAPTMDMQGVPRPWFLQHHGEETADPIDCTADGWGVNGQWFGAGPLSGPFAHLPPGLSEFPLAIDNMGRKNWDRDWGQMLPSMAQMTGTCPAKVCSGFEYIKVGGTQDLKPGTITGGDGDVVMRVSHEVQTGGDIAVVRDPESRKPLQINLWAPRFQPVASRATARVTHANIPAADAKAELRISE